VQDKQLLATSTDLLHYEYLSYYLVVCLYEIMNKFIRTKQHKKQHKNSNIQPSLHIHQTSGTPDQRLNTAIA